MEAAREFYENILPGNYFLTKSMELTRIDTSGTLWYMKKFLVLYYYIFLNGDIDTTDKKDEIVNIFNKFINSLDESVREKARSLFFNSHKYADLRSNEFRYFNNFCGQKTFTNEDEKIKYQELCKKYYFMFLLGGGGQSCCKAEIKSRLYEEDFTPDNLASIIENYYNKHPEELNGMEISLKIREQINDFPAALRNERQILFYLGYFHSKSQGSSMNEFSSLTPVGEVALKANFQEFLVLWEHQKIKMVSQPVTIDIQNVNAGEYNYDKFAINYSPYLEILSFLERNQELSREAYRYILSRKTRLITDSEWVADEQKILNSIEEIKQKVTSFSRRGDIKPEDFDKEIKKYLLGIRSDLPLDSGTNPISFCSFNNDGVRITNSARFKNILNVYKFLDRYKVEKYQELFKICEKELKNAYLKSSQHSSYQKDSKICKQWTLYNIHLDKYICVGVISAYLKNNNLNLKDAYETFSWLLKINSLNTQKKFELAYNKFEKAYNEDKIELLSDDSNVYEYDFTSTDKSAFRYEDLKHRIEEESKKPLSLERQRNKALINLMKQYYINQYADKNGNLACECCGEKTFMAKNNQPYIEFHHLIPFAEGGPDHVLNIFAICPNCHRKIHFALDNRENYYHNLSLNNYSKILIIDRLKELYRQKKLKSYHLDYLIVEGAITDEDYEGIVA